MHAGASTALHKPPYPPPSAFAQARDASPASADSRAAARECCVLLSSTPRASDVRSTEWNGGCEDARNRASRGWARADPGTTGARDVVEQG
ncbi:hypothetical protein PLICRDRAFT_181036 [Plicaturopsis crispa FD-325 SS-3]|uniref:Uncharacterized protein n=1 Tax=Plicaturopsis crispa FD-325 SS-3 TaxID=944288 RepID=A0A0C9T0Y0_PLICR|nr:hypothetical protein PLICRDRAFT_181036 [Plicaturopsis crispa FD-325 SS-3]